MVPCCDTVGVTSSLPYTVLELGNLLWGGGVRGLGEEMLSIPKLSSKVIALGLSLLIFEHYYVHLIATLLLNDPHFSFNGRD